MTWIKICPKCGKKQEYSCKKSYYLAVKINANCRCCAVSTSHQEFPRDFFNKTVYRQSMSESLKKARKTDSYGDAFKEKCRKNRAKQLQAGIGGKVNFNSVACQFIDKLNKIYNWNLVHAMNGGESCIEGFFVDGFDTCKNIVFEYDEPKHHTLCQQKRDSQKTRVIIESCHPEIFWRYDEKNESMWDVLNKKEVIWQHR